MFLDNFTKKQYKAYKNGIIVGIYNSKDMADKDLKSGYLDRYEEVPEQIQFNGKFYNKFEVPIQFYANNLKFKLLELYYHYIVTSINSIIKLIKFCILPVFLVTLFILIFYICVIGYNNIPENKSWIDYVSAIAPTIVGLGSVITAIWAIGYTKQSIKQQQEQWLKNEFIKREAQIIIDFREKFDDAKESIFWFLNTFMQPCKCNNFIPTEEQLTIKVEEFNKHYNE